MANVLHNIICLEAEWEYRKDKRNRFCLNTEPMLNWLWTFRHGCDRLKVAIKRFAVVWHYKPIMELWSSIGSWGATLYKSKQRQDGARGLSINLSLTLEKPILM